MIIFAERTWWLVTLFKTGLKQQNSINQSQSKEIWTSVNFYNLKFAILARNHRSPCNQSSTFTYPLMLLHCQYNTGVLPPEHYCECECERRGGGAVTKQVCDLIWPLPIPSWLQACESCQRSLVVACNYLIVSAPLSNQLRQRRRKQGTLSSISIMPRTVAHVARCRSSISILPRTDVQQLRQVAYRAGRHCALEPIWILRLRVGHPEWCTSGWTLATKRKK